MAMSNAQKQAALRARRLAEGLVLFQAWVTPAQAARLKAVISHPDLPAVPPGEPATRPAGELKPRRRRRKVDPVAERNLALIRQHREEITARLRAGQKPTEIAAWLQTLGFVGSGATFNGFWREV